MMGQTKSSCGMQDAANDSTFPQFTQLPPELRRIIWLLAAQIPRTIEVSQVPLFSYKLFRLFRISKIIYYKLALVFKQSVLKGLFALKVLGLLSKILKQFKSLIYL